MDTSPHDIALRARVRIGQLRAKDLSKEHVNLIAASKDASLKNWFAGNDFIFDTTNGVVHTVASAVVSEATVMGLLKEKMLADFGSNRMVSARC